MGLFRGKYEQVLDVKNRIRFPSKFRIRIKKKKGKRKNIWILTNSISDGMPLLDLFSLFEWEAIERKIRELPQAKKEVMRFQRFYLSSAHECEMDKNGRLLIPRDLKEFAGLKKNIVIVGMAKKIEIWSKENWTNVFEKSQKQFEEDSRILSDLGL